MYPKYWLKIITLVVLLLVLAGCGAAPAPVVDTSAVDAANAKAATAEAKVAEVEAAAKAAEAEAAKAQANAQASEEQIAAAKAEAEAAKKEVDTAKSEAEAAMKDAEAAKAEAEAAMKDTEAAKAEAEAAKAEAVPASESMLPVDVPRNELFVADQIYRFSTGIGNYNLWGTGDTPHRHALMMETLWYRDQETGERIYGVAISDPEYNADFTQMTVKLRDNLYWSDDVQFTADDLVYTIETLVGNPKLTGSGWSAQLNQFWTR